MKVLIACEFSGIVREAFNSLHGVHAISCDLLPPEDGRVDFHYQGDVRDILNDGWDLVLAFPPCTDLAVSGARYFKQKRNDGRQQISVDFFLMFTRLKCRWGIENPVGIMSTIYRKPDQVIHPWQFGHPESKTTCLWLNNLPHLVPTKILDKPKSGRWDNQTSSGQNRLAPSPTRWMERSRTYSGIAMAMAEQWGRD